MIRLYIIRRCFKPTRERLQTSENRNPAEHNALTEQKKNVCIISTKKSYLIKLSTNCHIFWEEFII